MVNPGAFQGARKAFLMGEKQAYSQAVDEGYVAEAVAKIQRRYFKRFPVDLPEDIEPTAEELAAVDDDAVEPEFEEPDPEKMTREEYERAMVVVGSRRRQISFRRSQIKRWLAYQYTKDHDVDTKSSGVHNPYRALLFKLTGQQLVRPRAKTAVNVWRKTQREAIEVKVKTLAAELSTPKTGLAALRDKVARDMYCELSEEDRRKWKFAAEQESTAAQKQWEEEVKSPPSGAPEDRQRCILGLVRFMQPILNLVCEATGWKASFVAGGPEPAHDGKLNIISIHSGKTAGDIPLDFGTLERDGYKKYFLPMYGSFLKKCYSIEECHARALKAEDSLSLAAVEVESEGALLSPVEEAPAALVAAAVAKRSQALVELRRAPATRVPKVPKATALPHTLAPGPSLKPFVDQLAPKPAPHPAPQPVPHPEAGCCPHRPALCPDDSEINASDDSPPCPITEVITEAYDLAVAEFNSLHTPPTNSDAPCTPPSRTASLPPSPPQSPTPSRPPSPLQPHMLPRPPSPPPSPSPTFSSGLTVPYHPPTPPASTDSEESNDSPSAACSLSGNASPSVSEVGSLGAGSDAASAASEPSPASLAPRRSKRLRSGSQPTTEPRPTKKGKLTRRSQASEDSTTADPPALDRPAPITTHSDAPGWFTTTVAMLQGRGLDGNKCWMDLVGKWAEFEVKEGYEGASRLSATARPEEISAWLHRKRSSSFRPNVDLRRYVKTYTNWWASLQPEWRVSKKKVMFEKVQGDWEVLRVAGTNGFVNVVVCLFYWGCAVQGRKSSKDWELYVNDSYTALTQLLSST